MVAAEVALLIEDMTLVESANELRLMPGHFLRQVQRWVKQGEQSSCAGQGWMPVRSSCRKCRTLVG